jgi:hypothetical protein
MQPHSSEVSESRIADREENAYVCAGRAGLSNLSECARAMVWARSRQGHRTGGEEYPSLPRLECKGKLS